MSDIMMTVSSNAFHHLLPTPASQQPQRRAAAPPVSSGRSYSPYPGSIPDHRLPKCLAHEDGYDDRKDALREECQLWNPSWNAQITADGEAFLEEAACLGYTEDQSLAVLYVCKFDLKMARERLPKFRNIYIPVWSETDKLLFEEMLLTHGKQFHLFRQKLPHVTVKEMVNYYYYQKQVRKRESRKNACLTRKALELARSHISLNKLASLPVTPALVSPEEKVDCGSCFQKRNNIFKFGSEFVMCAECYSHYRIHHTLPPPPPADPFLPTFARPALASVVPSFSERITAQEREACSTMVTSKNLGLLRAYRREMQLLARAKEAAPSAQQHTQMMGEIRGVLAEEGGMCWR
ncbi:uncharacterized protein LOC129594910 isoform X2 [Paramacrobiotus metropolitanus]|uniref:uncharacterized protein LOC129594910 isoform X2 n=1 Tax=Paramacrobiotus metropolitanus TaxID=2943436 RepID=UPI00244589EC|nr:uncharacterized protein LOC129594910 isoform X2 [Paramacrobiotus metropolitanus]